MLLLEGCTEMMEEAATLEGMLGLEVWRSTWEFFQQGV
jgi:hypothetical protein